MRFAKLLSIVFCIALLVPGYASGTATFTFDHPGIVTSGQLFDINVYLSVDNNVPVNVHAYQYCLNYDQTMLELVPLEIPCCPVTGLVDGQFFRRTYSDNCTEEGYPTAQNCCSACSAVCNPPIDPPNILFVDLAGFDPGEPPVCECEVDANFPNKLVSTLTFRALPGVTGTAFFSTNPDCTGVFDCEDNNSTTTVVVPPVVIVPPVVPALSGYGIGIFALVIAISFILVTRRLRKIRRNTGVLLVLLALSVALGMGMVSSGLAAAASSCPDTCKGYNLDLNGDKLINVADLSILAKCLKSSCASTNPPAMDVDGNGVVDKADEQVLLNCLKSGCYKVEW